MSDHAAPRQMFLASWLPLSRHARVIVVFPLVATAVLWIPALFGKAGYRLFAMLTHENGPVEIATFLLALLAAGLAWQHARTLWRRREARWAGPVYFFFAVGMFLVAMEEIAWGQHLLRFQTPAFWSEINVQRETTLHNVEGLQGKSEYFRLAFCLGGLVGLLAGRFRRFSLIGVSPLLGSWLAIMTGFTVIDVVNDHYWIQPDFDRYTNKFSEAVELAIATVGVLYVRLNVETYLEGKAVTVKK